MKQLVLILVSLVFIGCGDGEDRVSSSEEQVSSANMIVPLEVGETRTFALNLNMDESYLVTAESKSNNNIVSYRIDYLNRSYPEVVVTGVNDGIEDFTVTAEDASGYKQVALVRATVYEGTTEVNGTAVDVAGTVGGGSSTDGGDGGDGGDDNPPVVDPISDPNACLDSALWGTVTDSWGTTEGQFSSDLHYWIRSQVSEEPSSVTLYYKKFNVTATNLYRSLGTYSYTTSTGFTLRFDMQVLQTLIGVSGNTYFYIKARGDCYRGVLPTSILMPADKTLTPVFSGSIL